MGRPKKPDKQKIIQGTFRKDRAPKAQPKAEKSEQNAPPWWLKGHIARKAWRELYIYLKENGRLTKLDEKAFEMLVTSYADWRTAREKAKIGTYKTDTGYFRVNPMIAVQKIYFKQFNDMLVQFGMTPISRIAMDLHPEAKTDDPIARMLRED